MRKKKDTQTASIGLLYLHLSRNAGWSEHPSFFLLLLASWNFKDNQRDTFPWRHNSQKPRTTQGLRRVERRVHGRATGILKEIISQVVRVARCTLAKAGVELNWARLQLKHFAFKILRSWRKKNKVKGKIPRAFWTLVYVTHTKVDCPQRHGSGESGQEWEMIW